MFPAVLVGSGDDAMQWAGSFDGFPPPSEETERESLTNLNIFREITRFDTLKHAVVEEIQ